MNNRLIITLSFALTFVSCQLQEANPLQAEHYEDVVFYATMEETPITKTILNNNGTVIWGQNEEIKLFFGHEGSKSIKLTSTNEQPSLEVVFHGSSDTMEVPYYAIYPYNDDTSFSSGAYTVTLPSSQTAVAGSFDTNLFISVANTDDSHLYFKNVCGGICFSVVSEGVKSATLIENGGGSLAGKALILTSESDTPRVTTFENINTITLTAPEGKTFIPGEKYYIVCYPDTLANGYTLLFTKEDGTQALKEDLKPRSIKRATWGVIQNADKSLSFRDTKTQKEREREALIAIWRALNGENWTYEYWQSGPWSEDNPIENWSGLEFTAQGTLKTLELGIQGIGELPDVFDAFQDLKRLKIEASVSGAFPTSIGSLNNLEELIITNADYSCSIPEAIYCLKKLKKLSLTHCGFTGSISTKIGQLSQLQILDLSYNYLTGIIPDAICDLADLVYLDLCTNLLTGELPSNIGNLNSLESLILRGSALDENDARATYSNSFGGQLPSSMQNLINLKYLILAENEFDGNIPDWIWHLPQLIYLDLGFNNFSGSLSSDIQYANNLALLNLCTNKLSGTIPEEFWLATKLNTVDLSNWYTLRGRTLTNNNSLTGELSSNISNLKNLYSFRISGNQFYGEIPESITTLSNLTDLRLHDNNFSGGIPDGLKNNSNLATFTCYGNKLSGTISTELIQRIELINTEAHGWSIQPQQDGYGFEFEMYESTDYSRHKEVVTLQRASEGSGINIVLMIDSFTDKKVMDGSYDRIIQLMYESLFREEPFTSHKQCFNVYGIVLVSKNSNELGQTALNIKPDPVFYYSFNRQTLQDIVNEAIPGMNMDDLTISIVTPIASHALGCASLISPNNYESGSLGLGVAVTHLISLEDIFKTTLIHETCGHAFGKLADEYYHDEHKTAPDSELEYIESAHSLGWYCNVDTKNTSESIMWHDFLSMPSYVEEGIGIYEGACRYDFGVWRPSPNSIMNSQDDYFNAPSRYAIYKRIHMIAFDEDVTFEDFVEWDTQHCSNLNMLNTTNNNKEPFKRKTVNCVRFNK